VLPMGPYPQADLRGLSFRAAREGNKRETKEGMGEKAKKLEEIVQFKNSLEYALILAHMNDSTRL